ncbi:MAG: hypothetical protein ACE1S7_03860 [Candidatus Tisiphia sp.]
MNCCTEFLRKYYPVILCLFLMSLHFASAYPGGMSFDSFDQYGQSINKNYFSHHPPLMSMVWSLFHYIYQGPQTILLLNLGLLWGGVLLLFYADSQNKYRWLYLLIPFLPNILSQSGTIWKDVAFAFGSFFVVATCIFHTYRQNPAPLWVITGLLLIVFYVVGVKFQAQFIAPILILFVLSIYLKTSLLISIILTCIISLLIIYGNAKLTKHFSTESHAEQLRQLFDIAGVSVAINNDDLVPKYVKEDQDLYSFKKLKVHYTPRWVDPLIFGDTRIYASTADTIKLQEMESAYKQAITHHPLDFLKHRTMNFVMLMKNWGFHHYAFIELNEAQKHGMDIKKNYLKNWTIKYLKLYPKILTINLISFILTFVYLISILTNKQSNSPEKVILAYIVAISIVFSIVLFFATMACDYRYYYVIRILTLFSLPIYLKFRQSKKRCYV